MPRCRSIPPVPRTWPLPWRACWTTGHCARRCGARGLARAARFTWERTAAETMRVYQEVCRRRATRVAAPPADVSPAVTGPGSYCGISLMPAVSKAARAALGCHEPEGYGRVWQRGQPEPTARGSTLQESALMCRGLGFGRVRGQDVDRLVLGGVSNARAGPAGSRRREPPDRCQGYPGRAHQVGDAADEQERQHRGDAAEA